MDLIFGHFTDLVAKLSIDEHCRRSCVFKYLMEGFYLPSKKKKKKKKYMESLVTVAKPWRCILVFRVLSDPFALI